MDFLLLICIIGLVFTSLNISNNLFHIKFLDNFWPEFSAIHKGLANLSLIIIALHIGLHWASIMHQTRKLFNFNINNFFRTLILRLVVIIIAVSGVLSFINLNIPQKIVDSTKSLFIITQKLITYDESMIINNSPYQVGSLFYIASPYQIAESDDDDERDGTTSSTTNTPVQNIDGKTSSTVSGNNAGIIDGVTSSTTQNVVSQTKYAVINDPEEYMILILKYFLVLGLFITISYYSTKYINRHENKKV